MNRLSAIPNMAGPLVYIVSAGPFAKIGHTTGLLPSRVDQLQTGCPYPIQFVQACVGSLSHEAAAHRIAAQDRTIGEWFHQGSHYAKALAFVARHPRPPVIDGTPPEEPDIGIDETGLAILAAARSMDAPTIAEVVSVAFGLRVANIEPGAMKSAANVLRSVGWSKRRDATGDRAVRWYAPDP